MRIHHDIYRELVRTIMVFGDIADQFNSGLQEASLLRDTYGIGPKDFKAIAGMFHKSNGIMSALEHTGNRIAGPITMIANTALAPMMMLFGKSDGCALNNEMRKYETLIGLSEKASMAYAAAQAQCAIGTWRMKGIGNEENDREFFLRMATIAESSFGIAMIGNDEDYDYAFKRRYGKKYREDLRQWEAKLDRVMDRMYMFELVAMQSSQMQYDLLETKIKDPLTGDMVTPSKMNRLLIERHDVDVRAGRIPADTADARSTSAPDTNSANSTASAASVNTPDTTNTTNANDTDTTDTPATTLRTRAANTQPDRRSNLVPVVVGIVLLVVLAF